MLQNFLISNEEEMILLGNRLQLAAKAAGYPGCNIYLKGDLGIGKTTLVRGFVQGFGYQGSVKSPTYTLVEPYTFESVEVNHFDLYRLNSPQECEDMGIRDYLSSSAYCLIEWPEKGEGVLPQPNLTITIQETQLNQRKVALLALDDKGQQLLLEFAKFYE